MAYRIKFGDPQISEVSKKEVLESLDSNWVTEGPKVKEFESKFGRLFDYKHSIAVSNGTSADTAACMILYEYGAKRGDEIIAPALAFTSVGESILQAGFVPKFVDIERGTLNINPNLIEEKITPKTRAIMVVHTMGKPCKMDYIMKIAKKHGLMVIEDACEAHGAKFKGKYVGHWGDVATFSFYAAHLIFASECGMVSTNHEEVAKIIRSIKSHGRKDGSIYFDHERLGSNFKTTDTAAAMGLGDVSIFWEIFNKRKRNINYLLENVKDLQEYAWFNSEGENEVSSPHAFSITLKDEKFNYKEFYEFLDDSGNGIECKRNFGSMPTQHKAYGFLGYEYGDFPEAEYVGNNGLHFGIHQQLNKEDLDYALERIHDYFNKFVK